MKTEVYTQQNLMYYHKETDICAIKIILKYPMHILLFKYI